RVHETRDLPLFPRQVAFHSDVPDIVLDDVVLPAFHWGGWLISWFRVFQQGNIQSYLLYVFLALIALLLWRSTKRDGNHYPKHGTHSPGTFVAALAPGRYRQDQGAVRRTKRAAAVAAVL